MSLPALCMRFQLSHAGFFGKGSSFNCASAPNRSQAQLISALLLHRNLMVAQRVSCRTLCNARTPRARSPGCMPGRHSTSGCCWNDTRPLVTGWTPSRRLQPHRQSWCRYAIVEMILRKFACPVIARASATFHLHTCICVIFYLHESWPPQH